MDRIEDQDRRFWNENLLEQEIEVLKQAGFRRAVDFYDVPFVGLSQIRDLNHEIALDVLFSILSHPSI